MAQGPGSCAGRKGRPVVERVNPYQAIEIDPLFATEHPPILETAMGIEVNAMQVRSIGVQRRLKQLLDMRDGGIMTAQEVGYAPPSGVFGYGSPGGHHTQRWGKRGTTSKAATALTA